MNAFGKKRRIEIDGTEKIDPTREGFFDLILNYDEEGSKAIGEFIEGVREIKGVDCFWVPIFPTYFDGKKIVFESGHLPEINHSFDFWKRMLKKMPFVRGKEWKLGSRYQWYAYLVQKINILVECDIDVYDAMMSVLQNPKDQCYKLLSGDDNEYWITGGELPSQSDLIHSSRSGNRILYSTGWYVLT